MYKSILVTAAVTFGLLAATVDAAELKIGVVNPTKLITQSPGMEEVRAKLEEEFAPQRRELMAQQNELKTLQEKFQRDAQVMSESERANMERRIRDLGRDLQFKQQTAAEDFRARQNEELARLQREMLDQVGEFAEAQGYELILLDGVAYRSDALDVTDAVLAYMNSKK